MFFVIENESPRLSLIFIRYYLQLCPHQPSEVGGEYVWRRSDV